MSDDAHDSRVTADESGESGEMLEPIVVDYGPVSRKAAKKLCNGRGRLLREVIDITREALDELGEETAGRAVLPVIVVYRYPRKKGRGGIPFPFPFRR